MELPGEWLVDAHGADFASPDGRVIVEVKARAQGMRDLRAALMGLAVRLAQDPKLKQAVLVIHLPRVSLSRIQEAWKQARAALRPDVAQRLALAALALDYRWVDPPTPRLEEIAAAISSQIALEDSAKAEHAPATGTGTPFFFEIVKVLLEAWLKRRGALRVQQIMERVGCSHPTVANALDELERRREIIRTRDRRVELRGLPRQTLDEAVILSESLRQVQWITDASGVPGDPAKLLRRLQGTKLPRVAVGGVVAARHYDPAFDLHGTPRIDLTVWSPRGVAYDWASIANVYPGWVPTIVRQPDAIIAVHRLARAEALFEENAKGLPYADPVETLLDLYELRLTAQAQALVKHMRGDAP